MVVEPCSSMVELWRAHNNVAIDLVARSLRCVRTRAMSSVFNDIPKGRALTKHQISPKRRNHMLQAAKAMTLIRQDCSRLYITVITHDAEPPQN